MVSQVQLSRSALKKQLHKAMNFAKDMVVEQETLLNTLNQKQLENKAVKKIGADMATRMDSLKSQLKVRYILSYRSVVLFSLHNIKTSFSVIESTDRSTV